MANQQQGMGGNSMAAMLGNMQNKTQRNPPRANMGAGMQPTMRPATPTGQPIPPGGQGYPQMSPAAMQTMMGQLSQRQQQPKNPNAPQQPMPSYGVTTGWGTPGSYGLGQQGPMPQMQSGAPGNMALQRPAAWPGRPPLGNPAAGAGGGKNQAIANLPGGPGR